MKYCMTPYRSRSKTFDTPEKCEARVDTILNMDIWNCLRNGLVMIFNSTAFLPKAERKFVKTVLNSDLDPVRKGALSESVSSLRDVFDVFDDIEKIIALDSRHCVFLDRGSEGILKDINVRSLLQPNFDQDKAWSAFRAKKFSSEFIKGNVNLDKNGANLLDELLKSGPEFAINGSFITTGVYQIDNEVIIQQNTLSDGGNGIRNSIEWHYPLDGSEGYMMVIEESPFNGAKAQICPDQFHGQNPLSWEDELVE